jgi:superfamily II DNA or RNA helicase
VKRAPGAPSLDELAKLRRALDDLRPDAPVRRPPPPAPTELQLAFLLTLDRAVSEPKAVIDVLWRRVPKEGKPDRWGPARITRATVTRWPAGPDRALLEALLDATTVVTLGFPQADEESAEVSSFALSRTASAKLLPLLGRSGKLRLRGEATSTPLVWHEAPFALRLRVALMPDGGWEIAGMIRDGASDVPLARLDRFVDGGYVVLGEHLARLDHGGASSWLGMLRTHGPMRVPEARRAGFLEELFASPTPPPLDLPAGLALAEIAATPTPRLVVHTPDSAAGSLFAELTFLYEGAIVRGQRPGRVVYDPTREALVRRSPEAEAQARAQLDALGIEALGKSPQPPPEGAHLAVPPARLPEIVAALEAVGWRVEAGAGRAYRAASGLRMALSSDVDWFEIDGDVDFGGVAAKLPRVLDALRRGQRFVVLDDGSLGVLPEAWLAQHGLVVLRLGASHEGRVRFARSQAPLLAELCAGSGSGDEGARALSFDRTFAEVRAAIAADSAVAPADPPPGFLGELRGYQRAGLGWLQALSRTGLGGLLADDMGLGKTVQVLAHLAARRGRPSLVVAPRSLVFNWKREAARFTPDLRVLDHTGGDRRPPGDHFADHDLIFTTYGTLRRDADALAAIRFDHVVLDEAQAIKNEASDTSRAARRLAADHRLALSGTPVENHLGELWSLVEFLNPGMLGRATTWKAVTEGRPNPEAIALLGRALRPLMLRRTKAEVAPDLPARMEETWVCELEGSERALYDELRDRFRAELLQTASTGGVAPAGTRVLEALLRLRQAACHPGLVDPARRHERSAKLDALLPELLSLRASGQKALVFSQFRSLLDIVKPALEAEGLVVAQLDGQTRDREALVQRFQEDPTLGVLLISLKAGGVGLNLTAAEYVFVLDPWWNPAAEAQAIDRAHRIGQTKPVFAYRLIARDTVEERIAELQQKKRALADSVIRGDGAPLQGLTVEDLERLFS